MIKDTISLDELQWRKCMDEIHNDAEIKTLQTSLASLMQTAIPYRAIVQPGSIKFVYSPEVTELKTKIEKRIEERITEIQSHYGLLRV